MVAEPAAFFVSGGTVPLGAASYVAREADRTLLEALRAGRYAYVLTSRQMGKSSLSVRTMEALRREGARTAFVDLTRIGGRNVSAEQWYAGLLGEIGRGLGNRAALLGYWKAHPDVGPMQRFFGALREAVVGLSPRPPLQDEPLGEGERVVVFIDEIDATRSLPFSTDEFFAGIRECFNRRVEEPAMARLAFCLIGVAIPSDLMSDAKLTPFNIGERIVLRDFTLPEALALGAGLGPEGGALVARVHHWTGGHPFLTQSLCRRLAEAGSSTMADVDRLVAEETFGARARETNVNLADVGNRVLNGYDDPDAVARYRADVLSLYESVLRGRRVPDDESNRLVAVLKLAGLVSAVDGRLRVRNRIYARAFGLDWVRENMPNQERQRQRAALRVGALRAAAVGAAVCAALAALGVVALRNQGRASAALALAQKERDRANLLAKQAEEERDRANGNAAKAQKANGEAQGLAKARTRALRDVQAQKNRADAQTRVALKQTRLANEQRGVAEAKRREALASAEAALQARGLAKRQATFAKGQTLLAVSSAEEAKRQSYDAYANAIGSAQLLLDGGNGEAARSVLHSLSVSPHRGWEYGHLRLRLAQMLAGGVRTSENTRVPAATADPNGTPTSGGGTATASRTLTRFDGIASAIGLSASGKTLVAVCGTEGTRKDDGLVRLIETDTGKVRWEVRLPVKGFLGAHVSPDGSRVAVFSFYEELTYVLSAKDGRALGEIPGNMQTPRFSPDGRFLLAGNAWSLYDANTLRLVRRLPVEGFCGAAFRPDGKLLAIAQSNGTLALVRPEDGKLTRVLPGFANRAYWTAFSPDGRSVLAVNPEGVRVWRTDTGKPLLYRPIRTSVGNAGGFSPDGMRLFVYGDHAPKASVGVWDLGTGRHLIDLRGPPNGGRNLFVSSDGTVYVSEAEGTVRAYKVSDASTDARLRAQDREEDARKAREDAADALRVAAQAKKLEFEQRVRPLMDKAIPLVKASEWTKALPYLDRALKEAPVANEVRRLRVEALGRLGRFAEAEADLRFLVAHADGTQDEMERYQLAVAVGAQGHQAEFARLRRALLSEPGAGREGQKMRYLLVAGAFSQALDERERSLLARAASDPPSILAEDPTGLQIWNAYSALALVRIGRDDESIQRAAQVQQASGANDLSKTVIALASILAKVHRGDVAQGRADWEGLAPRLKKLDAEFAARRFGAYTWPIVLEIQTLRREVERLLLARPV